jgi:hypothetical protein
MTVEEILLQINEKLERLVDLFETDPAEEDVPGDEVEE